MVRRITGRVGSIARGLSSPAARRVYPCVREAQQDRCCRCLCAARSGPLCGYCPGTDQVGRTTSLAGVAPYPLLVDEHPDLAHQCATWFLPGIRPGRTHGSAYWCRGHEPGAGRSGESIPLLIRGSMKLLIEEIRLLELRISQLEKELTALAKQSPACTTLLSIPGVGLLTATAMAPRPAAMSRTSRMPATFFASWFGLTPRSIPRAAVGSSAEFPRKAIVICACC